MTDDVRDHSKARKDEDVHLRMAEEPEQMLIQDGIPTTSRIEERRVQVTVRQEHGDCSCQDWETQQQKKGRDGYGSHKQRDTIQAHPRRTHVDHCRDEVDGTKDRRNSSQMKREDAQVHRSS